VANAFVGADLNVAESRWLRLRDVLTTRDSWRRAVSEALETPADAGAPANGVGGTTASAAIDSLLLVEVRPLARRRHDGLDDGRESPWSDPAGGSTMAADH
jgi:hypothetical protein